MTLRRKTLLIISVVIVSLSLILVFSANKILLGGFSLIENRETEFNLSRAVNAVKTESSSLAAFLEDWAAWDDTYQFVSQPNTEFLKKNVTPSTFLSQQLHLMVFLDPYGNVIHGT